MADTLSIDQLLALRARAQRLEPSRPAAGVAAIVRAVGGLQAQEPAAAALGVRARGDGLTAAAVERARVEERSVARTWAQRGTLHLLATEDLDWLLPLLGPVFISGMARRHAELGIAGEIGARGVAVIRRALAARGPLTRAELAAELAAHGLPAEGQAVPHLVARAALEGQVCFGPDRDGASTTVLLDDWLPRRGAVARETALAELARRYLAAYGPAAPEDLARWSGLGTREARAAWRLIAGEARSVTVAGRTLWLPAERAGWLAEPPPGGPLARLLPAYDALLLGYRDRALVIAPEHARRLHPGGGVLRPALLVDGRVAGIWRTRRQRGRLEVEVEPFAPLPPAAAPGLAAEIEDVERFLEA